MVDIAILLWAQRKNDAKQPLGTHANETIGNN